MLVLQRSNQIPKIPKDYVQPKIVAGVNALGRGQDREALTQFMQTVAGTLGAEAILKYINPDEAIKRLAAAQGIDYLNLVKTQQQLQQEAAAQQQQAAAQTLTEQAGQFANAPVMDPDKNPDAIDSATALTAQVQNQLQPPE